MDSSEDLKQTVEDLKLSVEMVHTDNREIKSKVSDYETEMNSVKQRLTLLEQEMRSLRGYVSELESYCVSMDSALRKHHLIISGLPETKGESLSLLAYRVLKNCCVSLEITDLDYCYRMGAPPSTRRQAGGRNHRSVLVKLIREGHCRQIYSNKLALKQTQEYSNIYLNEDLPQVIAQKRADIRSVYMNAVRKGHTAKMIGSKVLVDNVTYHHKDLEILPPGLRLSDSKII